MSPSPIFSVPAVIRNVPWPELPTIRPPPPVTSPASKPTFIVPPFSRYVPPCPEKVPSPPITTSVALTVPESWIIRPMPIGAISILCALTVPVPLIRYVASA